MNSEKCLCGEKSRSLNAQCGVTQVPSQRAKFKISGNAEIRQIPSLWLRAAMMGVEAKRHCTGVPDCTSTVLESSCTVEVKREIFIVIRGRAFSSVHPWLYVNLRYTSVYEKA